jgi:23S rRNA (uracil1939-C5)-methyltransferase
MGPVTIDQATVAQVTVEIDGLAPGGDAVGRQRDPPLAVGPDDGRVTFVPLAAPGERVRARIDRAKGRVAWAELISIERPSPDRVPPPCPLFGACGGCQWQHVSIEAQRAAKQKIVERALGTPIGSTVAVGPALGYRDRAKMAVGAGGVLGFHARRSGAIVDVPACPLLGAQLARALPALRTLARGLGAGVEIDLQAGAEGVHVNVADAGAAGAAHLRREIDRLGAAGVVGIALAGAPMWGRPGVDVAEPGSPPLTIPAGGFAQVGRAANAALVAAVLEAVGAAPGRLSELYAGSGNFTRHLPGVAPVVHASDGDPGAVARGRRNAPGADWAPRPPAAAVDTVVLDPPREGADAQHLTTALRARRRIVYVSCDPQTLGRDARRLRAGGFRLARAVALDLMPQTFHAEVVATFERGATEAAP